MTYQTILYTVERGRARITLNRPEKRNALSKQLRTELSDALWNADDDTAVHSVILRGAGPSFCAGYDMTPGSDPGPAHGRRSGFGGGSIEDMSWDLEQGNLQLMPLFEMHKPVLAGVHGYCVAGGTDVAFLSDIVVATDDALFGYPPVRDQGGPPIHLWTYLVGPQWAKRFLLTGDLMTGRDAARIRLVYKSVPDEAALGEELDAIADKMALIDNEVLATNKRQVNLALELMGMRTMQRLAAELDARGHLAPGEAEFYKRVEAVGVRVAARERDAKFGGGRVTVDWVANG